MTTFWMALGMTIGQILAWVILYFTHQTIQPQIGIGYMMGIWVFAITFYFVNKKDIK